MLELWRWRLLRWTSALEHLHNRRLTSAGRLLLYALIASGVLGVDTTQSMAYQAFAFFLSLLALALAAARLSSRRVEAHRRLPPFGTAGQALPYKATVINLDSRPARGLCWLEDPPDPRPSLDEFKAARTIPEAFWLERLFGFDRWRALARAKRLLRAEEAFLADLPARASAEVALELAPARRGRLTLGPAALARTDPLGLVRTFLPQASGDSIAILPKRYPVPRLTFPGARRYQLGGVALSSSIGDSEEFVGLRDYRPGDPLRRIHWRSWPKAGRPIVREFEDEYFVRHALALDTFAKPGREEVFEEAVSAAASFACSVLTQESLLDLLFVGAESYCLTAGRGLGGAARVLEVLAGVQVCRETPFEELSAAVLRRSRSLSAVLCILLAWDEPRKRLLTRLRAQGLPVVAAVVVAPDEPLAEEAGVFRLEAGNMAQGLARVSA